jgi:uncharacterized protein YuzE
MAAILDILCIRFTAALVEESDEKKPGIIWDDDKDGHIAGMEILRASKRIEQPKSVEYHVSL